MNEPQRSEQVQSAVVGDPDALQNLIIHYHEQLHHTLAARILENETRHLDPDDILQDAYVAAFKSVSGRSFDGPGGFYKWLETIALNQLTDARRAIHRQKRDVAKLADNAPRAATTTYPDLLDRLAADQSTPSRHLRKAEATAAVISSLARLTGDQRQVIKLRFLESRPIPEIATQLGKSEDAIHMLTHRALKALRQALAPISCFLTQP